MATIWKDATIFWVLKFSNFVDYFFLVKELKFFATFTLVTENISYQKRNTVQSRSPDVVTVALFEAGVQESPVCNGLSVDEYT